MLCKLDHLSVVAPTLDEGVKHIKECLDIDIPFGRKHVDMGTHNHLLSLGEKAYLEVIAADTQANTPAFPRWFGLDNSTAVRKAWDQGRRLRAWVASTRDIDQCLVKHALVLGVKRRLRGGATEFFFTVPRDGALPKDGAAPFLIDRLGRERSIPSNAQLGCVLTSIRLEHPQFEQVNNLIADLNVLNAPQAVFGSSCRMVLSVDTPSGERKLC